MKGFIKWILSAGAWVWRHLSANQQAAFSILIKNIAADLIKAYIARNPKTLTYMNVLDMVNVFASELMSIVKIEQPTAVRIIRSIIYELATLYNWPGVQNGGK